MIPKSYRGQSCCGNCKFHHMPYPDTCYCFIDKTPQPSMDNADGSVNDNWIKWIDGHEVYVEYICDEYVEKEADNAMGCGHNISEVVSSGEGTNYCGACERESRDLLVNEDGNESKNS